MPSFGTWASTAVRVGISNSFLCLTNSKAIYCSSVESLDFVFCCREKTKIKLMIKINLFYVG